MNNKISLICIFTAFSISVEAYVILIPIPPTLGQIFYRNFSLHR